MPSGKKRHKVATHKRKKGETNVKKEKVVLTTFPFKSSLK
jgi:hypothetical protein